MQKSMRFVKLRERLPALRRREAYASLREAFAAGCDRNGFRLIHYAVLNDHLHFVVEAIHRTSLSRGIQGLLVRVARTLTAAAPVAYAPAPVAAPAAAAPAAPAAAAAAAAPAADTFADAVKSPMVGTVYLAPEPGAANFAAVGSAVKAGDTILIIEAMKVMNPISAPAPMSISRRRLDRPRAKRAASATSNSPQNWASPL